MAEDVLVIAVIGEALLVNETVVVVNVVFLLS